MNQILKRQKSDKSDKIRYIKSSLKKKENTSNPSNQK